MSPYCVKQLPSIAELFDFAIIEVEKIRYVDNRFERGLYMKNIQEISKVAFIDEIRLTRASIVQMRAEINEKHHITTRLYAYKYGLHENVFSFKDAGSNDLMSIDTTGGKFYKADSDDSIYTNNKVFFCISPDITLVIATGTFTLGIIMKQVKAFREQLEAESEAVTAKK